MARSNPKQRVTHYFREWRQHRGLTQQQAADRMGVDQGNLSKIENGKITWDEHFLYAAAHAYSCEVPQLFSVNPLKEGEVVDLMDALRQASPEDREQLQRFADFLKIAK